MQLAFTAMAAGKDVPPAEAEDSDSSEEEEEEEEDDSDKEGKKEKERMRSNSSEEGEDEKEDDKEYDEDVVLWPAEQFTVAVKYFPQLLQVLHRQPMTRWVTLSKTLSQLAATPNSLTDLLSEVVERMTQIGNLQTPSPSSERHRELTKRSFASQLRRRTKTVSRHYFWARQSTARCIPQVC